MTDSVGSVSVDVVPDARGWAEKLRAQIRDVTVTVKAEAETTEAKAELDEAARTRTAKIKANVDKSGLDRFDKFLGGLSSLPAIAIAAGSALIPLAGALGGVVAALGAPLAIVGAGGTLYGFLAGAAVKQTEEQEKKIQTLQKAVESAKLSLSNAQASASTSASSSLTAAHASAAASLKSAQQSAEASIQAARRAEASATTAAGRAAARQRIAAAEQTLAQRRAAAATSLSTRQAAIQSGQSASVAAAQRKVNQAVDAYHAALKGLSPEQQKFLDAQSKLKAAFQNFIDKTGPALLGPLTEGLGFLTRLLPSLQPIIGAFGTALKGVFDQLGRASQSHGFESFVQRFAHQLGPDLTAFAGILGNLTKGVGELFLAIDRRSGGRGMLREIEGLTQNFAKWADSRAARRDVQNFFDYAHRVGPQVADTLGAIARATGHFVEALAPLGPPILHVVQRIADAISGIPVPVLTALAGAFVALTAVQKVGGLKALSGLEKLGFGGGILSKVPGLASGTRGSSPANPVWVASVDGGGRKTGVPVGNPAAKGGPGAAAAAEEDAIKAAKAAAEAAKAAGGDVAAQSSAAARAFKEAIAAADLTPALDFAIRGGIKGLLRTIVGGPIIPGQETANHPLSQPEVNAEFLRDFGGRKTLPSANTLKAFGLTAPEARTLLNLPELKASATHVDALRASLGRASQTIDQIGPHATAALHQADIALDTFRTKWELLHDKHLRIILQDEAAVRELERIQAMRINDKYFNIYARNQAIERTVGPGGGMGRPALTSSGSGGGGAGVTYTGPITVNAQDHADMQRQMQRRQRQAAISGVQVGP